MREREQKEYQVKEMNEHRMQALKEIANNSTSLADGIKENLQRLTDMAPGLNRNPYVQAMRTQIIALVGQVSQL